MNSSRRILTAAVVFVMMAAAAWAQEPDKRRVVTPVGPETNIVKPPARGTSDKEVQRYLSGDTLAAEREAREDSIKRSYKRYPRVTDITVHLDWLDLLLMACGQDYCSVGAGVTLNMWNRLQPVVELGLGRARITPDGNNFTYRGKWSPYFKVGANYNFLFKGVPDYQLLAGLRLGCSPFRYDITDVTVTDGYWQETDNLEISGQSTTALWTELAAGIKVKIAGRVSVGWMIRYHIMLRCKDAGSSHPWFVPGYGTRDGHLQATAAVCYSF